MCAAASCGTDSTRASRACWAASTRALRNRATSRNSTIRAPKVRSGGTTTLTPFAAVPRGDCSIAAWRHARARRSRRPTAVRNSGTAVAAWVLRAPKALRICRSPTTSAVTTIRGRRTAVGRAVSRSARHRQTATHSRTTRIRNVRRTAHFMSHSSSGSSTARSRQQAPIRACRMARSCQQRLPPWAGRRFPTRRRPTAWSIRCSTTTTAHPSATTTIPA